MKYILLVFLTVLVFGCKNEYKPKALNADEIINKSIEVSGGSKFDASNIKFMFRDKSYNAVRNNGKFELSRLQLKEDKTILDFISNNGFKRIVDGLPIKVSDSMAMRYSASVNSVHYFSVLPYSLNDKAVQKTLLGEEQIKDITYYKIKVTFNKEGGGEDYEDVFMYWIDKECFKVYYLAYSYNENDDIGMRFREAYNERYVNGIRFVDYINYKTEDASLQLFNLGKAFENNQLELLSKIELENVEVQLIDF